MAHIQLSQTLNLSKPVKLSKPWQNLLVLLANYGMVLAFSACLAYWVWVFLKPSPIPATPISAPTAQTILPSILAGHWFNNAQAAPIVAIGNINLKLVGIFSSTKKRKGFAIFQLADGKQTHAVLNNEITPGVKLVSISRNEVSVLQNGVTNTLTLEGVTKTNHSQAASATVNQPANNGAGFNIQTLINKKP